MFDTIPPEDVAMRPSRSPSAPDRCPWGCDLALGGVVASYSHWFGTSAFICTACRETGGPKAGEWITIDPAAQRRPGEVDGLKLTLMVVPPDVPAGAGQIQLIHHGQVLGYVELALCSLDRRAVVVRLEVAEDRRRHGIGRVLAEAARIRCADYEITTAPLPIEPVSTRFWAHVGLLGPSQARPCRHQVDAGIVGAGWEADARRANQP